MAKVTVKFADSDQNIGRYEVDCVVEDAMTDDGMATAAHVTGMFMIDVVSTEGFAAGTAAYGQQKGWAIRKDDPTELSLILTDVDLETGQLQVDVIGGEDAIIENSVTAAYMAAMFMRDAMGTIEFTMGCTEFAHKLVEGREGFTVNDPIRPAANSETPDTEVA